MADLCMMLTAGKAHRAVNNWPADFQVMQIEWFCMQKQMQDPHFFFTLSFIMLH